LPWKRDVHEMDLLASYFIDTFSHILLIAAALSFSAVLCRA